MRALQRIRACALAVLALLCAPAQAQDAVSEEPPLVSLVTFGPGTLYWERFGHDALLLRDARSGAAIDYNYGMFDFNEKNFMLNFARGIMRYRVAAAPFTHDLSIYQYEGRWVQEQTLNLTLPQRAAIRDFLAWNVQPENLHYPYDYFRSNCTTRVRDVIDRALAGALKTQLATQAHGPSYRSTVLQLMSPDPLLRAGMDLGLGPLSDAPLNRWDESFIPMVLMQAVREVHVDNGAPLVAQERQWLAARIPDPPAQAPDWRAAAAAIGLLVAALLLVLARLRDKIAVARIALGVLAAAFLLSTGVLGLVIAAMWGLTAHWGTWNNVNLLLVDPLALPLCASWLASLRQRWQPGVRMRRLAVAVAALALLCPLAALLVGQANAVWVLLLLPAQLVLAWALHRVSPSTEPTPR